MLTLEERLDAVMEMLKNEPVDFPVKAQVLANLDEIKRIHPTNTGAYNTGNCNTGDWNTGGWNTGDCNTGNCNTGNCNTGNCNTGGRNTGDCNTGGWNTGNCNTGDWNTGSRNTGDWNTGNCNTGCFCIKDAPLFLFDQPTTITHTDWETHPANYILSDCPVALNWVAYAGLTEEQKTAHPDAKKMGGALIETEDLEGARQVWWDKLPENSKECVLNLPNFDAAKFYECTLIRVDGSVK